MKTTALVFLLTLSQWTFASEITDAIAQSSELKIQVISEGKKILADSKGLTLYTFDNDTDGVSTCFDSCLRIWPALLTKNENQPTPFKISLRPDGSKQINLDEMPLYYFKNDKIPGDIKGDGLGGVWHIVELD